MPKAPPRIPSTPATRRVFAHLLSVDVACPSCGTVHTAPRGRQRARVPAEGRGKRPVGYDQLSGVFRCRVCRRAYLLGVLFWPLTGARKFVTRPADSVPTPGEALTLRQDASRAVLGSYTEARGHANRIADDPTDPTDPTDDVE